MAIERTFAIIKPDAVGRNLQGEILARIHKAGFKLIAIKSSRLTKEEAGGFYAVHRQRPMWASVCPAQRTYHRIGGVFLG